MSLSNNVSQTSKKYKFLFLAVLFIIASLMNFFGVRALLPVATNFGRGMLIMLPALLTYAMPLFGLVMFVIYHNNGKVSSRWKMLFITGYILLLISILNIILILILLPLEFDSQIIYGGASKYYPLDVLIFNILYILLASCILLVSYLNKENKRSDVILFPSIKKSNTTLACFYLIFATYFFGEALFGFHYFVELPYVDKNFMAIIFSYLAFLIMPLGFLLYLIYFTKGKDYKTFIKYDIIFLIFNFIVFLGIIIIAIINPYVFSESLQYEFMIGFLLKFPVGLVVIAAWSILTSILMLFHVINKHKREVQHE